ncbi:hypothetical protein ACFQH6_02650 [Halobacteriaceae archaeon GCM10025711]
MYVHEPVLRLLAGDTVPEYIAVVIQQSSRFVEVTSEPPHEDDGFIREDVEMVDLLSFELRVRTEHPVCDVWTDRLGERDGDSPHALLRLRLDALSIHYSSFAPLRHIKYR